jgi:hypothetical protein
MPAVALRSSVNHKTANYDRNSINIQNANNAVLEAKQFSHPNYTYHCRYIETNWRAKGRNGLTKHQNRKRRRVYLYRDPSDPTACRKNKPGNEQLQ